MHGEMPVNGPGVYVGAILLVALFCAALFVLVDVLRRPRHHLGVVGRIAYPVLSAVFLVTFVGALAVRLSGLFLDYAGTIVLVVAATSLISALTSLSYFLDVVFPPAAKLSARAEIDGEQPARKRRPVRTSSQKEQGNGTSSSREHAGDGDGSDDDAWFDFGDGGDTR